MTWRSRPARFVVEELRALDVRHVARRSHLPAGSWEWIELDYELPAARPGAVPERHQPSIEITWTVPHFGGLRPWFRCPRCSRRCAIVYLRHMVACRLCFRAKHRSNLEDDLSRSLRRLWKILARLGHSEPVLGAIPPPKPKWMRWPTYERLLAAARAADGQAALRTIQQLPVGPGKGRGGRSWNPGTLPASPR